MDEKLDPLANEKMMKKDDDSSTDGKDLEKGVSVGIKVVDPDSNSISTGDINYKTMSWQRCAAVSNRSR